MRLHLLALATTPAALLIAGLAAAQTPPPAAPAAPTAPAAPAAPPAPVAAPGVADEIKLKDGTSFRGTITESVPGDHFDLLQPSGQVRRFPASDVTYAGPAANAPATPPAPAPTAAPAPAATSAEPTPQPAIVPPDGGVPGPWRREDFYRRAPDAPASSWLVSGLLGFEFEARAGIMVSDAISPVLAPGLYPNTGNPSGAGVQSDPTGQILRGTESPYAMDPVAISLAAGYRFLPYLSAGAFFDYANFGVNDNTDSGSADSTSQLERQVWQLGAYVRFYGVAQDATHTGFPYLRGSFFERLQPWIELGVGYSQDTASYVRNSVQCSSGGSAAPCLQNYYLNYNGVATNLRIGLDWRLAPIFSLGPVLGYGHTFGVSSCADSEVGAADAATVGAQNQNTCGAHTGGGATANDYGIFFGGIFAKVTLGPDVR